MYNQNISKQYFVKLEQYKHLFLFGFESRSLLSLYFLKKCPFKDCAKLLEKFSFIILVAFSKPGEYDSKYNENTQNYIMHVLRICRTKFDIFFEYVEFVMLTDHWTMRI